MIITAALLACAVNVAPNTLNAIVRVESGGDPLALHVNRGVGPQPHAATVAEAATIARKFPAAGYSVDLGLMQVNSRNLLALGYTIRDALDPCRNIAGGAAILTADYARGVQQFGEGQRALLAALSAYNTGDFARGFTNGYVGRVIGVPAIAIAASEQSAPNPCTATTLAYSREAIHADIQ